MINRETLSESDKVFINNPLPDQNLLLYRMLLAQNETMNQILAKIGSPILAQDQVIDKSAQKVIDEILAIKTHNDLIALDIAKIEEERKGAELLAQKKQLEQDNIEKAKQIIQDVPLEETPTA